MQICGVSALGLVASLSVARNVTFIIIAAGLTCLIAAFVFAYKHKVLASASTLLVSLSSMLFALAATGAGLFDLAILGYPTLIIFAAILGGVGLFLTLLFFVTLQCVVIVGLSLQGIITPHIPSLSWEHLIFTLVIFIVTGFSVYILVRDIKDLMTSLQGENIKVAQSRTQIQHLAHHDSLTNLPNRLYGETLFNLSLSECEEHGQSLALLFIDLDNFKPINDALGHAAGDQLLKLLTQQLTEILSPKQYLIRFGGDEFLVIAPINPESDALTPLADSLIGQCASVFDIFQNQVRVSASLGTASAPKDGTDFKQLCRKADIAMYKAKQDGRNTYHHYDESLDKASENKFKMLQLLRPALNEQQFELHYQPIVDLKSGNINTLEALLRWPQPDGSMIPPDLFIPLAESSGLINELGSWVVRQATQFCAQLRQQGHADIRMAVNLSVMQFKDGQLQRTIESALYEAGLPPDALELELTESLLIDETEQIQKQLASLSKLGITIAIDDFGTGYSNLGYLRNFNASKLKIDRSFISPLCFSEHDESLVGAIINMAASLGLKTVAEGIEDEETLQKLLLLGCDIGQGYFWSKPLPENALMEFLKSRNT
ncbi:putative bifunctional diguanylate cyclase/phosphodiesterase [Alteromonas stellipolaris]|uniref:putative bifunctional diguanylate cyclase/phosphodiesterase n=1 Tax=Alteromonas stellipolaris TaxID=233316 RepID=UPI000ADA9D51|nr:EAL domain-containing protein [Alteromonas stellipolaris]MDO6534547.1 EAL domain-containing protein [Alteromonas stellipolaris]MDO6626424.1 EAL domain-containing protein [Alteromonas stellipolaris]